MLFIKCPLYSTYNVKSVSEMFLYLEVIYEYDIFFIMIFQTSMCNFLNNFKISFCKSFSDVPKLTAGREK